MDNVRLKIEPDAISLNYTMEIEGNKLTLVTTFGQDIYGFGDEAIVLYFFDTE